MQNLSTKTLTTLEWPRITEQLAQFADSPMGKERCRELTFHTSLSAVREVQAETSEMRGLLEEEAPIPLAPFADLREALALARIGAILPGETLVEIRRLLGMSAKVSRFLAAHRESAPHLAAIGKRLTSLRDLWKRLCVTLSERGEVLDHASPALKTYRREAQALHHRIKRRLEEIVARADYLQEDYYTLRGDRYVLPVKVEMRNRVKGIVHDTSGSGQTIYIEPSELVELNNEVRLADLKVEEEIRRILGELTAQVAEKIDAISENLVVLAHLDFIHARARLGQALEGVEPIVTDGPIIDLVQAANPVLLLTKSREEVVANDIALHGKALILSGPNTGGKTVTLKTVGLCALMVRAGLHIPAAPGSRIGVFPDIFADIGDEQSISGSLSTFSGHIYTLVEILGKVKRGSLVLLDEIAVGTDPIQGTALARALLEHFVAKGARVIVTTHYEGLKTLGTLHPDYENASVTFDLDRMQPTYRVILGQPGKSYALEIAERLGIPPEIIARAHAFLGAGTRDMERVLSSLEAQQNEYLRRNREIETLRTELLELKEGYRRRLEALAAKRRDLQTRIRRELDRELERVKREMNRLLEEAQNEARGDPKRIVRLKKRAGRLARSVVPPLDVPPPPPDPLHPIDWDKIRIGDPVRVRSLGKRAVLLTFPDHQKRVRVGLGEMTMSVGIDQLEADESPPPEESPSPDRPSLLAAVAEEVETRHSGNTCDLRGMRVEEALSELERFLDTAALRNESPLFLIHGHGTGALKAAVRNYLAKSAYVRRWRPGEIHEGGDGVSVVYLR